MEALEACAGGFPSFLLSAGKDHDMASSDDFDLWLGRIGSDTPKVGKTLARARRAGGPGGGSGRRFTGARLGRGNGVGRVLGRGASRAGAGARRVVVKSRIVKLGKGMAAAAHLRYLQRDGTTRDGERGSLYGRDADRIRIRAPSVRYMSRGKRTREFLLCDHRTGYCCTGLPIRRAR